MKRSIPRIFPLCRRPGGFVRRAAAALSACALVLAVLVVQFFVPASEALAQLDAEAGLAKCKAAGWKINTKYKTCAIGVLRSQIRDGSIDRLQWWEDCRMEFPWWHKNCFEVFGPNLEYLPDKTEENTGRPHAYNCAPNPPASLTRHSAWFPLTYNRNGEEKCKCAVGSTGPLETCVCPLGQVVQNGACKACPAGTRIVDGACECPIAGQSMRDGVCQCAPGHELIDGVCGCPPQNFAPYTGRGFTSFSRCEICPEGQGVLSNGWCGACPGGTSFLVNGYCTAPEDPFQAPPVIKSAAPVVPELLAYDGANLGTALVLRWGAPLDSGRGGVLQYRARAQRSVAGVVNGNTYPGKCDTLGENQWDAPEDYEYFDPNVFEKTYDSLANHACWRFFVSARNAAGWGAEAVTDPLLTRSPQGGSAVSCAADQARAWDGSADYAANHGCLNRLLLQGVDWCSRVSGGGEYYPNGYTTNAHPSWTTLDHHAGQICHFQEQTARCGPYRRKQIVDGDAFGITTDEDALCYVGEGPGCPDGEIYDFAHRECMCEGMGKRNERGACECPVESANNECKCGFGSVYHPDLNKCLLYAPWGEEFALTSPVAGTVAAADVGEVKLRVYQGREIDPFPDGGVFNVYAGDSRNPLTGSCRNAALKFKAVTLANPTRVVAGAEGTCRPGLPEGTHRLRAEYQLRGARPRLLDGTVRECNEACQELARLRAFALPAVSVTVGRTLESDCENPNPAINPAGGEWDNEHMQCDISKEAFYNLSDPLSCTYGGAGGAECDDVFARMRQADCPAAGLVYAPNDYSCVCPEQGTPRDAGGCRKAADELLLTEVQKSPHNLATIRALLDQGANPDVATEDGRPVLFVAVTLARAEVVSVLITAGANASAKIENDLNVGGDFLPEYIAKNGLPANGVGDEEPDLPWRDAAEVMIHFGGGARVFSLTAGVAAYDWANTRGAHYPLNHLIHRYTVYDTFQLQGTQNQVNRETAAAMAGYLLDQGSPCPAESAEQVLFCALSRPQCPTTGDLLYSCSAGCPGYSTRSAGGGICVSQCETGETTDTAAWPDARCRCAGGETPDEAGCPTTMDDDFLDALRADPPNLATVRFLLDQGVRPGITTSAGIPALFVAATLGRADVVSVLITAGANASAQVGNDFLPAYLVKNGLVGGKDAEIQPWRDVAEVLIHFGGAINVVALTSSIVAYDWRDAHNADILRYLDNRYSPIPEQAAVMRVIGGYLLDQGAVCPADKVNRPICASRPACSAADSGKAYSCSICSGFPLRAVWGNKCVAACGDRQTEDADAWPDAQCMCAEGVAADEFGCESDYDATLIQEVLKPSPNLATVRFLLDQGARPGIPGASSGVPLLFLAAYLRHPEVVSVLITAGAAPDVQFGVAAATVNVDGDPRPLPLLLAEQAHAGSVTVGQRLLDVFLHYGAAAGPEYNWREPLPSGAVLADEVLGVLALIANRETAMQVTILQQIGGYLRGLGGRCPTATLFFQQTISASPVCTGAPVCQEGTAVRNGVCLPNLALPTAEKCQNAGWEVSADQGGTCGTPVTLFGGESSQRCHLSGTVEPQCSDVFGASANDFPAPVTTTLGATLHFVYNCDPRSESRLIPANANTVGATECACPVDGEILIDGVCQCPAGEGYHNGIDGICAACPVGHFVNREDGVCTLATDAAEKCRAAGRTFDDNSDADAANDKCMVEFFNGFSPSLKDGCETSGEGASSCSKVFGPNFDFPDSQTAGPFVFGCEPMSAGRGVYGLIPAAANTVGATACACADNMVRVNEQTRSIGSPAITVTLRGACVPPDIETDAKKCINYENVFPNRSGKLRELSVTDAGVSCVDFKFADGAWTVFDRCYLSGSGAPQCSEVLGEDFNFPAAQLESPPVYNCDPDGTKNMIPATVNTIGATECACVDTDHEVLDGVCKPPPNEDLLEEVLKITTSVASEPVLASIRYLLSRKTDPNITTSAGIPLLARAVTLRNLELISVLIAAGADQNTRVGAELIPVYALKDTRYSMKENAEFLVFVGDAFHAVSGRSLNWPPGEVFAAIKGHYSPNPGSPTLLAESEWLLLQSLGGYMVDRGLECTSDIIGEGPLFLCTEAHRRCSAAQDPRYYSCGECPNGNNILALEHRLKDRINAKGELLSRKSKYDHSCTASCGGFNVVLDEEAWPDPVCMCASGAELNAHNQCEGPLDGKLFAEVSKVDPPPVLSSVIALLDDGANPNIINDDGVHILAVAATLLHAEIISVLVSAGADAAAHLPSSPPIPNLILSRLDGTNENVTAAMRVVEATRHFGDVATFDWRAKTAANADLYVSLLSMAYEDAAANEEVKTAVKVAAEYVRDQGGRCEEYLGADSELCAPSRTCLERGGGGIYSCSECPGLPLRPALAGGKCVAACGINEEDDPDAVWPDSGCRCKNDVPPDEFGCPSSHDDALIEEARKPSPVLASVIALLSLGARPDITTSAGVPILIVAATMLHADMVSVLITAGADPGATGAFPQFFAGDSVFVPGVAVALASVSSRDATEMLIHFGGALSVAATSTASFSAASFSWGGIDAASRYQALSVAYDGAAAADKVNMEAMAGYLQDQGLDCAGALGEHPLCAFRRSCSSSGSGKAYSCSACPGLPLRSLEGGACAAACEINQEADATTWPDAQCRCADGAADAFGCPSRHDDALIAEVSKPSPILASVRHWLSLGARANVTTAAGTPLLVVAATLLHVNVVSLLIAEGADAAVRFGLVADTVNTSPDPRPLPLLLAEQAYAGNVAIDQRLADMFFYFGFVAGGVYDWREELSPPSSLADHIIGVLALAEGKASEEEIPFLREIGGYLRGLDGECPDSPFYGADISEAKICTVTVFCPDRLGELRGELCISREGSLEIYSDEDLCGAFGGDVETGGSGGDNVACSGVDANDTFCFLDSTEAFPCRGLFKHLQICNIQNNRKALNPFFCGRICGEGAQAIGGKCCPGDPGCPAN